MPEIATEKNMVISASAPRIVKAGIIAPGLVVLHVEADGVAHYVKFGPSAGDPNGEADFAQAELLAVELFRCIGKARLLAELRAAPTLPTLAPPSNG